MSQRKVHPYLRQGWFTLLWKLSPFATPDYRERYRQLAEQDLSDGRNKADGITLAKFTGMKLGEWVRHKLDLQYYQIKKMSDTVLVLNCQQPYEITKFDIEVKTAICHIKNLEPVI